MKFNFENFLEIFVLFCFICNFLGKSYIISNKLHLFKQKYFVSHLTKGTKL